MVGAVTPVKIIIGVTEGIQVYDRSFTAEGPGEEL